MGIYSEYLEKQLSFQELTDERKKQLKIISKLRGDRDVLVYAADLNKRVDAISINYADLLPISDQLSNLKGNKIDIIIETPGGSGEVAEDIVRLLHDKYDEVGIIIPGWAKSAGTIIAMSGDEILMGSLSALGPIDAQLNWQGKHFSAHALIEGLEKIKKEIEKTGVLNKAYIPILQGISPGEIKNAENALKFAEDLVKKWLVKYKFKNWDIHSSNQKSVTTEEKEARAKKIAKDLCNHGYWKTHGRSIKLKDFDKMRIKITDYSKNQNLNEAITRYYTLLQMTFATTIYKVFETQGSQIYRFIAQNIPQQNPKNVTNVIIDFECSNCKRHSKIQANLDKKQILQNGCIEFPKDNKYKCQNCQTENDLSELRREIEAQTKKIII
ncbi:Clp protease ClpP [Candidatus Parcubacteria bacterium]|nr:Clp protease ClpP [Candidatus Parcubacteria bacterium]